MPSPTDSFIWEDGRQVCLCLVGDQNGNVEFVRDVLQPGSLLSDNTLTLYHFILTEFSTEHSSNAVDDD